MRLRLIAVLVLLLCSVATTGLAEGTKVSMPLAVPSGPKARYTRLEFEQVIDRVILATTMREGPSGVSYATRVIDCGQMRFKYLAEGDTLAETRARRQTNRAQISSGGLGPLIRGSISDYVARQACAAAISPS